jgi:hypothetical protein
MRSRLLFSIVVLAFAACDRVTSPSIRDGGADSLASLWEMVDAGAVNYNAVAGSAPDNVFIVGDQGTILHWDGITLQPEVSGTTANLRGISVMDPTKAVAVGEQGTILQRMDGVWIPEPQLTTAVLNAVFVGGGGTIVVGEQGTILIALQGSWGQVPNPRNDNYYALTYTNAGLLVVGALGVIVQVDYTNRIIAKTGTIPGYTKILAGVVPYSEGALVVGVDGGFFYWVNGTSSRLEGFPQKFLRAISYLNGTAWIVGHEGLVVQKSENADPVVVPTLDDRWLLGVYAAASDDVWFVGRSGLIMRGPPGVRGADGGIP